MPVGRNPKLDPSAVFGVWGCFLQAIEQPELGFDLAFLRAKNPILTRAAVGRRKFTLTPHAYGNVATGLVTGRLHIFVGRIGRSGRERYTGNRLGGNKMGADRLHL